MNFALLIITKLLKTLTRVNVSQPLFFLFLCPALGVAQTTLHIYGPGLEGYSPLNPSTTSITADEINKQPYRSIDELLETKEGLLSFRRGSSLYSHPTTQGASLRGTAATAAARTLVLLDGVPLNDPFGGWIYWNRISPAALREIEISRNHSSLHFAPASLVGSVLLKSAEPAVTGARIGALGGNLGTAEAHARGTVAGRGRSAVVSGRLISSDGYHILRSGSRGAIDRRTGIDAGNVAGSVKQQLSDELTLSGMINFYSEDKENGTVLTESSTELLLLGSALEHSNLAKGEGRLSVYFQTQAFDSTFSSQAADRSEESPALDQHVPAETAGLTAGWHRSLAETLLALGGDIRWISGKTQEQFFYNDGRFLRYREAGGRQLFLGTHIGAKQTLTERLTVSAVLRGDYWRHYGLFQSTEELITAAPLTDEEFDSRSRSELSPRFGLGYKINDALELYGSLYHSYRSPTLNELVRPFRVRNDSTLAEPGLKPEKLYAGELGLRHESERFDIAATVFYQHIEDQVANLTLTLGPAEESACGRLAESGVCRRRGNLDETRSYGFELKTGYQLTSVLSSTIAYYFINSEVDKARKARELEGNELPQVPEHQITASLGAAFESLTGTLLANYVSAQYEDDLNTLQLQSYITLSARVSYALNDQTLLFVEGENLLDEDIEAAKTADGLVSYAPPLQARAGFVVCFP